MVWVTHNALKMMLCRVTQVLMVNALFLNKPDWAFTHLNVYALATGAASPGYTLVPRAGIPRYTFVPRAGSPEYTPVIGLVALIT